MKGSFSINTTYVWRLNDTHLNNGSSNVLQKHAEALAETAEERILNMIQKEGVTSGELHDFIIMDDEDDKNTDSVGVSYSGHWQTI